MFSRRAALQIAEVSVREFARTSERREWVDWDAVYDFFYEYEFDARFCNGARAAAHGGRRSFANFIQQLHTGETVSALTPHVPPALSEIGGQEYLRGVAEALLRRDLQRKEDGRRHDLAGRLARAATNQKDMTALLRALELDGYVFRDGKLLHVESSIVDVEKQHSALRQLAKDLKLAKQDVLSRTLDLSEEHYAAGRWEDCIGNSRKFLELCLQECASRWSDVKLSSPIDPEIYKWPVKVRLFLEKQGLLSEKEAKTVAETYGLLSETGNHPAMAANDQARLLRQVALLYSEFAMLRLSGALKL
jgi:hypothetical protein